MVQVRVSVRVVVQVRVLSVIRIHIGPTYPLNVPQICSPHFTHGQWLYGKLLYMGCSDVSEFEHIYGQRVTTPSCVYDR